MQAPVSSAEWLIGGGEMGELIRSMDWSLTPLGALRDWPYSLRTTVNLCLASNFPMNIVWGPGFNQIYNDGYRVLVGDKHPGSMGMAYDACWASAWPTLSGPFESAWAGKTSYIENQRMFLTRYGYLEETFFTFSLSPIRDERGVIAGLFHPVTETTAKMLGERRTGILREFVTHTSKARSLESAFTLSVDSLSQHDLDLPFVLLYALSADGSEAQLVAATGVAPGSGVNPERIDVRSLSGGWPIAEILAAGTMIEVGDLSARFGEFAFGNYPEGIATAYAKALLIPGDDQPHGVMMVGISPRLPCNPAYLDHLAQVILAVEIVLASALAHEQQRKRAAMLAEIDRAKTQFFTNVSHEFRTPLSLMLGPMESVLATGEEELSTQNRDQIVIARRNGLRLLKLVNSLLDFSQIEEGRMQTSFEAVDLSVWTIEIASHFRSAIEAAGLEFVVDCPTFPVPVYVDRDLWEKIVLNLLSNAFKFTMKGRITVSLALLEDHVALAVRDTGCGIAANQLSEVFKRFHRVEGAQTRTHEGSGIGLALIDEFSRLHQGSVAVESEEGKGSRFVVTVPRGMKHLPPEKIRTKQRYTNGTSIEPEAYTGEAARWTKASKSVDHGLAAPVSDSTVGRARIVLAEDNADMRDYILRVMGPDYEIEAVENGAAALAAITASLPDMVLSDVMMREMDGFALLRALRADPRTKALPIILLSARAGDEDRAEGIEGGADDYLVKPFSPRELRAKVRTQLELQGLRRENTAKEELIRTADALRQSEKLAVVGLLASSIAHEINNPLEAITNLLYLISGDALSTETAGYVRLAQAELARVTKITTQTLRFHKQTIYASETSLREVLESAISLFEGRPGYAAMHIERQYRGERLITAFDGDLRQVFANLVSNAMEAGDRDGRIAIRVRRAFDPTSGEEGTRVTVADNGHGMSQETQRRVFEPFFTTKGLTGTGLGLWVSSEILRSHKAKVGVWSRQGQDKRGTVFSIFFPVGGATPS